MTTKELNKEVVLTTAQFTARQEAGTLQEGVKYEISDYQEPVQDVKISGTSILSDGVANIPIANGTNLGTIKSVKLNNGSNIIDANGDVNIPVSTGTNSFGIMALANNAGLAIYNSAGYLYLGNAQSDGITARKAQMQGGFGPITTNNFDFAVKAHLTDGVAAAYSDAEKTSARNTIGAWAAVEYTGTETSYADQTWYYVVED